MRTFVAIFILLPIIVFSQAPYFTAFGQLTIPGSEYANSSNSEVGVKTGYGGGIDFSIHIKESLIWMTTATFSANPLKEDVYINDNPVALSSKYTIDNIPALTGIGYERIIKKVALAGWAQVGFNYSEFPSISGSIVSNANTENKFDSKIDGNTTCKEHQQAINGRSYGIFAIT